LSKVPEDTHSSGNTFYQLPRLAKKDMKFITSNLLDVGTSVAGGNPSKRSKQMAAELKQAVQRLKEKSSKRPAEVRLLDRVKQEHAEYY
jgi:hypothetical protein